MVFYDDPVHVQADAGRTTPIPKGANLYMTYWPGRHWRLRVLPYLFSGHSSDSIREFFLLHLHFIDRFLIRCKVFTVEECYRCFRAKYRVSQKKFTRLKGRGIKTMRPVFKD